MKKIMYTLSNCVRNVTHFESSPIYLIYIVVYMMYIYVHIYEIIFMYNTEKKYVNVFLKHYIRKKNTDVYIIEDAFLSVSIVYKISCF